MISRATGCLLAQLAGDALGSLVEFQPPWQIAELYPEGVRDLVGGGPHKTIPGQPTDDSEMALLLARMLTERGAYDQDAARKTYRFWLASGPFDCGGTVYRGLTGQPDPCSQANGALMRISPLGVFGASRDLREVAEWARQDAALTHPNPVCLQANALFAMAIAGAVRDEVRPADLYERILVWARDMDANDALLKCLDEAASGPPSYDRYTDGWVVKAFQNAVWELLHAPNLEDGVVDTVMRGGDTDTNAAICGALLGAVYGREAVPDRWVSRILNCRAAAGLPGVVHPRPECFWPCDALELAEQLVIGGRGEW